MQSFYLSAWQAWQISMKPGPKFGEILEAVETRQLEGALKTREEALDWVRREYRC